MWSVVLVCLFILFHSTVASLWQAKETRCDSLQALTRVKGHKISYQPPVSISFNSSRFLLHEPIKVTIESSDDTFNKVVIQARIFGSNQLTGHFRNIITPETSENTESILEDCGEEEEEEEEWEDRWDVREGVLNGVGNTAYVRKEGGMSKLELVWEASQSDVQMYELNHIYFLCEIELEENTHNITSDLLSFHADKVRIDDKGCNVTKNCYRYPPRGKKTCDWATCEYMLTYHVAGKVGHFEMSGRASWVAVAFSSDDKMGGDDVFVCIRGPKGTVSVENYYTGTSYMPPHKVLNRFFNKETHLSSNSRQSPPNITCRFSRSMSVKGSQTSVDLNSMWYQLYAWGPVSENYKMLRHTMESSSKEKVTLRMSRNVIGGSGTTKHNFFLFFFFLLCVFIC